MKNKNNHEHNHNHKNYKTYLINFKLNNIIRRLGHTMFVLYTFALRNLVITVIM